jgi:prolyl 4-hydroxylase
MAADLIEEAYDLAGRQLTGDAVALLERGGRSGDADCWVELAAWYLRGNIVRRDLAKSRECFRLAAELGHRQSRRIHIALLANGAGGPADWRMALDLLREFAPSDQDSRRELDLLGKMALDKDGNPSGIPPPQRLGEIPEVHLFRALLTHDECQYLIDRAGPMFQPAVVVDPATGRMRPHPVRTSENAMFPLVDETPAIHAINRRLALASRTSVENGEPLQVLRYRPGQEYKPHHDALPHADNQRVLTVLVYLNEGYSGGETLFVKTGLNVKGRKGDGLVFRNADAQGRADPAALHAGMPVLQGQKFVASRWIRERPILPS